MVKLNTPTGSISNGEFTPIMYNHHLNVKKSAPTFKEGESLWCYITKYDGGRFAVFSTSGVAQTRYHVFESEQELHDHFEEVGL